MKISFRVWILAICLALAAMIIINGSATSRFLAGFIILLVPIALGYINSNIGKIFVIIVLILSLFYIVSTFLILEHQKQYTK